MKNSYLFREGTTDNIKIGNSINPDTRIINLQVGNTQQLTEVDRAECIDGFLLEQKLHRLYNEFHIRGEWYKLEKDNLEKCITDLHSFSRKINDNEYTREMYNSEHSQKLNIDGTHKICKPKDSQKFIKIKKINKAKYKCTHCNYGTEDKSNFNKHLSSTAHINNGIKINDNTIKKDEIILFCECGKEFKHKSSLSRHKHKCTGKSEQTDLELKDSELTDIVRKEIKDQMNEMSIMLKTLLSHQISNNTNNTNNTNNINNGNNQNKIKYGPSGKIYIKTNYPNALAIDELNDYSTIKLDNKDLIDTLLYFIENKGIPIHIGEFIIKNYKKEDNKEKQSLWVTDVSRYTYFIKEPDDTNKSKSKWKFDTKGDKVKKYIINPILKYIKSQIDDYFTKNNNQNKQNDKCNQIINCKYNIMGKIDNGILSHDILKYITSHFFFIVPQIKAK